jgi:hypothetical protein
MHGVQLVAGNPNRASSLSFPSGTAEAKVPKAMFGHDCLDMTLNLRSTVSLTSIRNHIKQFKLVYEEKGAPYAARYSSELARRLIAGDQGLQMYLRMGWRLSSSRTKLLPPEDPLELIKIYLQGQERFPENERLYPSMKYWRGYGRNYQYQYRRILIDGPPEGEGWHLVSVLKYVQLEEWAREMKEGRMPFGFGELFVHDSAHLAEFNEYPQIRVKVLEFYRDPAIQGLMGKRNYKEMVHINRLYVAQELGALPNLTKGSDIQRAFPKLFAKTSPKTIAQNISRLNALDDASFASEIGLLLQNSERFFLRVGGTTRDAESMPRFDVIGWAYWENINQLRRGFHSAKNLDKFSRATNENIYVILMQVELTSDFLGLWEGPSDVKDHSRFILDDARLSPKALRARLRPLLIDRMARIEMALKAGIQLQMQPIDLYYRSNKSAQYFGSFTTPDDVLYLLYDVGEFDH